MRTNLLNIGGVAFIFLAGLVGCLQPVSGDVIRSDIVRTTPASSQADVSVLVGANTDFACSAYQYIKGDSNVFYSPYSISLALAMTYAGARNETEMQMAKTLHFTLPQDRLHPAFNSLDQELAERGKGAKGKDDKGFRLNVVNAIWGQKGYKFLQTYLDLLAANYGAGLRILDFEGAPDESRKIINNWVANQTEQRIKDLIPAGVIDQMTRLVLTNAIYFNAAWASQFQKESTHPDTFYLLDGSEVKTSMMSQTESLGHAAGDDFTAVELPYDGREMSMLLLIPEKGKFQEFEKSLSALRLQNIIGSLQSRRVALSMPRFKIESKFSLAKVLSEMGMPVAFTGKADFSGMTGNRDMAISDVIHQAFIDVNESGTEAAAATAVVMRLTAIPGIPTEVKVDRPFIFFIRDVKTGAVIFGGRVLNPAI